MINHSCTYIYTLTLDGVGGGTVVAVRRLSEGDDELEGGMWRMRKFESEVEAIGRVQHPNVVRLRAYYYASDEKLLVSDFIRGGSLYNALHGGGGTAASNHDSPPPLSWSSRLKIAQGAARGLTHIHDHTNTPRKSSHIHGNIKSSKILLDEDHNPYISGFGLHRLVTPSAAARSSSSASANFLTTSNRLSIPITGSDILLYPSTSLAYLAPEARAPSHRRHHHHTTKVVLTQKCDVYSFGIVLMEMLTGQLPGTSTTNNNDDRKKKKGLEELVRNVFRDERPLTDIIDPALLHEVHAKNQVLAMFHLALTCTEPQPELRPRMRAVLESLQRITQLN